MKRLVYILSLIFIANLNCGVKGPPAPPLPNEANLQKQVLKENEKAAQPKVEEPASTVKEKPVKDKKDKTAEPKKKMKDQ